MIVEKLLSIIIPIYNTIPQIFERCIKSIESGINVNKEIIVIDDGSDDLKSIKYLNICTQFKLRYFYQNNQGASSARNQGIQLAKGSFIMFVDADDKIIKADYLNWIEWMIKNDIDVLSGCIRKNFLNGLIEEKTIPINKLIFTYKNEDLIQLILTRNNYNHPELKNVEIAGPCCKIIKRRAIDGLRFLPDISIGEDMIFNIQLLKRNINYAIVNEIWYEYYIYSNSAMNNSLGGLENKYFAVIQKIKNMDLSNKEEEYLAYRALYHYIRILKLFISSGNIKFSEFISYINNMKYKKEWNKFWKKINLFNCNLEAKYKLSLLLIKKNKSFFLYYMLKLSK